MSTPCLIAGVTGTLSGGITLTVPIYHSAFETFRSEPRTIILTDALRQVGVFNKLKSDLENPDACSVSSLDARFNWKGGMGL